MLEFFRKYQWYFFLIVTIVIIISFSFFGTYSTLNDGGFREQVAFTAVDGTQVKRSDLDQLMLFIGTDTEDKILFGGQWGPNFLNDGVIRKDFLETGLAQKLASGYPEAINEELQSKMEKERKYAPYTHPQAPFVGVEAVWNYFAPDIKRNLNNLRSLPSATAPEAVDARVNLYLAQRKLPPQMVRQLLAYQQQQYGWLKPDPDLEHIDLSLFGYHTMDDWFGPRFLRLIGEFIINSSIIAERKGYQVTKDEALADLMYNAESSFKQNLKNPHLGVATSSEYMNEQLNRMSLNQDKAAAIWRKVLLFRRLFHDMGNSVFVDPMTFEKLNTYSKESVEGKLYHLPKELQFNSYDDLQKFEVYLDAISKRPKDGKDLLKMPTQFLSVEEVAKNNPELVQKKYLLDIVSVDKNLLGAKVSVKETWNWETEDKNWETLKTLFPTLATQKGTTREERYAILDRLDDKTRASIDTFARKQIVDSHPEWLEKVLEEGMPQQVSVGLKLKGGSSPIKGVENREALMALLDKAKIGELDPALAKYSADGQNYYRITVVERAPKKEIITFAEGVKDNSLEQLLQSKLEAYYQTIRNNDPQAFQNADKSWKPFEEVKNQVADLYFANLLNAISKDYATAVGADQAPQKLINELAASLRFYAYAREALDKITTDPRAKEKYVLSPGSEEVSKDETKSLADQWKFQETLSNYERGSTEKRIDLTKVFALKPGEWVDVQTPASGNLYFFEVLKKGSNANSKALGKKIEQARTLLSDDAQNVLMEHLLREIKARNAISLDYLSQGTEMGPES